MSRLYPDTETHHGDEAAGADGVAHTQPLMEVRILPSRQVVLAPIVLGFFVNHKRAALHSDGLAAAEEARKVCTVVAALDMMSGEVLVLIEDDLDMEFITVLFRNTVLDRV